MELTWEKKQELIKSFYLKKGLKQKYLIMVLEALNLNFSTFVALAHNIQYIPQRI